MWENGLQIYVAATKRAVNVSVTEVTRVEVRKSSAEEKRLLLLENGMMN